MGRYRAVVLGAGLAGAHMPQNHLDGYLVHPRCQLVGIIDPDMKALQAIRARVPRNVPLATELLFLQAMRPDLVSIATPEETHIETFRILLGHVTPKGIFMEKPIATTVAGAHEITDVCEQLGITLQVNHARAWDSDCRRRKPPHEIRHGGPPWRNDVHAHHLASLYDPRPEVSEMPERGLSVDGETVYGRLRPGTMLKAISGLIRAIEYGTEPLCSGRDATIAVAETLRTR